MFLEKNKDVVIILKGPGTACNIGCIYCAEARKTEIIKNKIEFTEIEKLVSLCKHLEFVTILFHGGEPTLLPISYYEDIIALCKNNLKQVYFGLQTNGSLLSPDWVDFLKKHEKYMGVSTSLDGSRDMNFYRRKKNGDYVYDEIVAGIRLLEKNDIKTGMISTITQSCLGKEEQLIDTITNFNNIRFLKINPCYDIWDDGTIPEWGITPMEYSTFICNFFDLMVTNNLFDRLNIEPILSIIKNIQNLSSSYCNFSTHKCTNFISVYPKGIITSCDNFEVSEGGTGNLSSCNDTSDLLDIMNLHGNKTLRAELNSLLQDCQCCDIYSICKGGCLASRMRYKKRYKGDKDIYCNATKKTVLHIRNAIFDLNV